MAKSRFRGVPRTAKEAKKKGAKRVNVNPHTLSSKERRGWYFPVQHGARALGPLMASGQRTVCYFDKNTGLYVCYLV